MLVGYLVEHHPSGYPRYSALLGLCDQFHICRRFSRLRSRVLLVKQNQLSILERQLDKLDREEACPLFLGCQQRDKNPERISLLAKIHIQLAEYDALVERNFRMFRYDTAQPRDVTSLQNWVEGNSCLARDETDYLYAERELLAVSPQVEGGATQMEAFIEDIILGVHGLFRKRPPGNLSSDPYVYIYPNHAIRRVARVLVATLILTILLVPSVCCLIFAQTWSRILTISLSVGCFVVTLAAFTRVRLLDVAVAGATYSAVLFAVFANNGIGSTP